MVGGCILLLMIVAAVFADLVATHPPNEMHISDRLQAPSSSYLMGTDNYGRDVFSRVVFGGRVSLFVGLATVTISTIIAGFIALPSGYYGGAFDLVLQRIVDAILSIPRLVFLLVVMAILGGGIVNVVVALSLRSAATSVRVIRGEVLSVKEELYVESARVAGSRDRRILSKYILPNLIAPMMVVASINLGMAILSEAALSFLGFGVPPPNPTWGSMLSGESLRIMFVAPWAVIFPGTALALAVFGVNVVADALRDVLDPKLRGSAR